MTSQHLRILEGAASTLEDIADDLLIVRNRTKLDGNIARGFWLGVAASLASWACRIVTGIAREVAGEIMDMEAGQ